MRCSPLAAERVVVGLSASNLAGRRRGRPSKKLFEATLDAVVSEGLADKVVLSVNADQEAAIGLYGRYGFSVAGKAR